MRWLFLKSPRDLGANTIHMLHGARAPFGGGGLRMPLATSVSIRDDLTAGVLHADREVSQTLRCAELGEWIRDLETVEEAVSPFRCFTEVVVWNGPSHREQLMLAWLVPYLRELGIPRDVIRLACPRDRRQQFIAPDAAEARDFSRGYMIREPLDERTEQLLKRLWEALTADTPEPMLAIRPDELAPLPMWIGARDGFLARYPDATGLGFHDRVLLQHCTRRWRPASRVLSEVLEHSRELAPISRRSAWRRLLRLAGNPEEPGALALRLDGHLTPGDAQVRLTELGLEGVEGTVDMLSHLRLTEWIGGTLVQSPHRVWRWREDGLVPDRYLRPTGT